MTFRASSTFGQMRCRARLTLGQMYTPQDETEDQVDIWSDGWLTGQLQLAGWLTGLPSDKMPLVY